MDNNIEVIGVDHGWSHVKTATTVFTTSIEENPSPTFFKHVLEYDNVMNDQRGIIYGQRKSVLEKEDIKNDVVSMIEDVIGNAVYRFSVGGGKTEEWDLDGLLMFASQTFLPHKGVSKDELLAKNEEEVRMLFREKAMEAYEVKEKEVGAEVMRFLEKQVVLRSVDKYWMEHIDNMDELRQEMNGNELSAL